MMRRTKSTMIALRAGLKQILEANRPCTIRQLFYLAVSAGMIEKTEAQYKGVVVRLLTQMRICGEVPFGWIADNTRWVRKPATYGSWEEAQENFAQAYRRDLWRTQPVAVECWCEKDAIAGVLYDVTGEFDVPLYVMRGYPSITYLAEIAQEIDARRKSTHVYYFGDLDPSGIDIARNVETRVRQFAPDAEIHFERVAVIREQVIDLGLQTRPTKITDSRARGFSGRSVEVDAIPPNTLRQIVRRCIEQHIDRRALSVTRQAEASERQIMMRIKGANPDRLLDFLDGESF
ncbi:MAG: hypothetical protein ABSD31_13645 [Candidatus Binataceae bacterium]|jgi:hypothetical protein